MPPCRPPARAPSFEAHGEIFTVPAEKGDTRNLTNTPGMAERDPSWSPDGKTIAYFSDASGEYQLYLHDQTGFKPPTVIDLGPEPSFFYNPTWSPDSKHIAYADKHLRLWVVDVPSAALPRRPSRCSSIHGIYGSFGANFGQVWSPDSKWIAYHRDLDNQLHAIFLYSMDTHKSTQVTDGMSDATSPAFDLQRQISLLHRVHRRRSLQRRHRSLFAGPRPNQRRLRCGPGQGRRLAHSARKRRREDQGREEGRAQQVRRRPTRRTPTRRSKSATRTSPPIRTKPPTRTRMPTKTTRKRQARQSQSRSRRHRRPHPVACPFRRATTAASQLARPACSTCRRTRRSAAPPAKATGPGIRAVWRFTLEKRKPETVLGDVDAFTVSSDGSKVLYARKGGWTIASADDLKPGDGSPGKPLNLGRMETTIDPRAEWRQIYHETWRIERDFLYDPNTHGLSIPKIEARYKPYLDGLASRAEFTYLSTEMLGEITIGHMFVGGPASPRQRAQDRPAGRRLQHRKRPLPHRQNPRRPELDPRPGLAAHPARRLREGGRVPAGRQRPRTARQPTISTSSSTAPPASRPCSTSAPIPTARTPAT